MSRPKVNRSNERKNQRREIARKNLELTIQRYQSSIESSKKIKNEDVRANKLEFYADKLKKSKVCLRNIVEKMK